MTDISALNTRIVVTGASRGIGLGLVKYFAAYAQHEVIATCRDPDGADVLTAFAGQNPNVRVCQLDVADTASVASFKQVIGDLAIDVLINNAGMYGPNAPLLPVDIEQWHQVFHLNCVAPVYLTQQLMANLLASQQKKVVSISSDMGSIASNQGGGAYLYRSSKAALNAAMRSLALDTHKLGLTVLLFHPGHVKTDMGGKNAKIDIQDSTAGLGQQIRQASLADSGSFRDWQGNVLFW